MSSSGSYFLGDEGNVLEELDGYTVVNVRAKYRFGEHASVFASIDNLLEEEYETFGVFGEADEVLRRRFRGAVLRGPGAAPLAAWIGVRVEF